MMTLSRTPIYRHTRGKGFCPVNRGPTVLDPNPKLLMGLALVTLRPE